MTNIALFASGNGTNVEQITEYFKESKDINVSCVVVNRKNIYVIERAKKLNLPCYYFNKEDFYHSDNVLNLLKERNIDYIILAGFLWLIPNNLLTHFPKKIINIHPALLPKYGGKGMYGHNVHQAVVENKETESGITIHYVNQEYDKGDIIFQAKCSVTPQDNADTLAEKIHLLEKEYFPKTIEKIITNK